MLVNGGGDTRAMTLVMAHLSLGAQIVIQLEMMPKASDQRAERLSTGRNGRKSARQRLRPGRKPLHYHGHDPQFTRTTVKSFAAMVMEVKSAPIELTENCHSKKDLESGRMVMHMKSKGNNGIIQVDLVLRGFVTVRSYVTDAFECEKVDSRTNVKTEGRPLSYKRRENL